MKVEHPKTSRAFLDIILSMLLMIILLINPSKEDNIELKTDYLLEVTWTWEERKNIDIDTYVLLPNNDRMSYFNKNTGHVFIDRDDLGSNNDPAPINIEYTKLRSLMDGWHYISVRNYNSYTYKDQKIYITLRKIEGNTILFHKEISMLNPKEEYPVIKVLVKDKKIIKIEKSHRYIV